MLVPPFAATHAAHSPRLPALPLSLVSASVQFVCPTEILSFSAAHKEFAALDTQVLAISTDSHHTHLAWVRTPKVDGGLGGKVDIPLVADTSKQISKSYGVLVEDER